MSSFAFGSGPFGALYGVPSGITSQNIRSSLSSARKIDGKTKAYVVNGEGGFEAMDSVAQRVLLLVSFNVTPVPFIVDRDQQTQRQRLIEALKPLTDGPDPTIDNVQVTVEDDGQQTSYIGVAYRNLLTNTLQTVERASST